jgi:hypothetical protein
MPFTQRPEKKLDNRDSRHWTLETVLAGVLRNRPSSRRLALVVQLLAMERSRREKKSRVDKSALEALAAARSGAGKRVAQVQVCFDPAFYSLGSQPMETRERGALTQSLFESMMVFLAVAAAQWPA